MNGAKQHFQIAQYKGWTPHKIGSGYLYYHESGVNVADLKSNPTTLHYWYVPFFCWLLPC
jgi:hypothetical protein